MVAGKVCRVCSVWKELDGFHKHVSCTVDGHKRTCITCEKKKKKEYRLRNKEKLAIKQKEIYEKKKNTPEYKAKVKAYQEENKEKKREYDKKYLKDNQERKREYRKRYNAENEEKLKAYRKKWKSRTQKRNKEYREKNREKITEANKQRWAENKEFEKERIAEWRKENAERIKAYRVANRERDQKYAKEWLATERGRIMKITMTNRYRAKKRGLVNDFTAQQWEECIGHFDESCAYCGAKEKLEQEHVIPVTKDGGLTKSNIVPACRSCNVRKSSRDFGEWYKSQKNYSPERENRILNYLGADGAEHVI